MMNFNEISALFLESRGAMTFAICLASGLTSPVAAQQLPNSGSPAPTAVESQAEGLNGVGRTSDTGIGEVGRRTAGPANINPLDRLNSRIQNRIQNRLRTRIDRDYDPMDGVASPFDKANRATRKNPPN
ncbi:hypothetical protein [Qipengyuania sp. 483]